MPDSGRPASGPAILERVLQVEEQLGEFRERAESHWASEERRFELIDRFIDPQLNLDTLIKQIYDTLKRSREEMHELDAEVRRLTGAVELLISEGR